MEKDFGLKANPITRKLLVKQYSITSKMESY